MNLPAVAAPPEVIEAFTSSMLTTLQELTQTEAFPEDLSGGAVAMPQGQLVLATVRLLRKSPGAMTLVLSADAASRLAERYLAEVPTLTDEMVDDVAGEFANVIAGQAKTMLKGTPYHFTLSTPAVIRAESAAPFLGELPQTILVSLATEHGRIQLRVELPPCPGS